jgi:hypothetical protein
MTALRVPVAEIAAVRGPRVTGAVRYGERLPAFRLYRYPPLTPAAIRPITMSQRMRRFTTVRRCLLGPYS